MKDLNVSATVNVGMDASAVLGLNNPQCLGKARHIETQWLWITTGDSRRKSACEQDTWKGESSGLVHKAVEQRND
eukprot:6267178-Heterocapsa_arctica.AAC.1